MSRNTLLYIGLAILAAAVLGGGIMYANTRGFRNNNPGNLKYGTPWKGVIGQDPEGYAIFDTMVNGVRALGKDLQAKINRGLNTIDSIMRVYAPASENPTENYIAKVEDWTGIGRFERLSVADLPIVMPAIIRFENGHAIDEPTLQAGILAMGS